MIWSRNALEQTRQKVRVDKYESPSFFLVELIEETALARPVGSGQK
jgi:hypothetical protein